MASMLKRLLLPGLVFQSMCIAGGYGTGRELVEFFLQYGPVGGLLGLLAATVVISMVSAVALELARMTRCYDYRQFLQLILGRAWVLYEIFFLTSVVLILAVLSAAIASLVAETFGIPGTIGTGILLIAIAFLAYKGTKVIEGVMSAWSLVLYAVYIAIFVASMFAFGDRIDDSFALTSDSKGWLLSGFRYGALQAAMMAAVLFASTHIEKRRDALLAGMLTGPLFLIPAILFFIAMLPHYPDILAHPVPVNYILELLQLRWLQLAFIVMLLGTFIETGGGLIHAFNERLAGTLRAVGKDLPGSWRAATAVGLLVVALLMSRFGLIELIALGYGSLTWFAIAVFLIPLFTIGLRRILR